jgi:hypothetical protein
LALRLRDQPGIGECAPLGFHDTHDLMGREKPAQGAD